MEIKLIIKHWLPYSISTLLFVSFIISCALQKDEAQEIVNKTIEVHGGSNYNTVMISFDFRDKKYTARISNGKFKYTRAFEDSLGMVLDVLDNNGFTRFINEKEVALSEDWEKKYSNSVNSVIYFAIMPNPLNDPAVNKQLIGEDTIAGNLYNKIKVTFAKIGGGEDFNDNFIFWIHKQNFTIDFFAYDYETEGGGSRFRKAINPQRIGGILFLDYINYEPIAEAPLENYHLLYQDQQLKEVSVISLKNIKVDQL
ncbi:MAG: hypothetical protein M3512_12605 [Bacteroidota bacterium]|nr:hypothetical protein [Bacteroidota bacterium]